ncbi:MAG: hypothetical protein V4621_05835 [Pseudomonadota bacterium]
MTFITTALPGSTGNEEAIDPGLRYPVNPVFEFKRYFNNQSGSLASIAKLLQFELREYYLETVNLGIEPNQIQDAKLRLATSAEVHKLMTESNTNISLQTLKHRFDNQDIYIVTADVESGKLRQHLNKHDGSTKVSDDASYDHNKQYGILVYNV